MSKYERKYGTDWEELDQDEAVRRAYALGVAASLGEFHPDELDRLRGEVGSSYNKSMVELAFQEGKTEGKEAEEEKTEDTVWNELVVGEVPLEDEDLPMSARSGLPDAVDITEVLERPDRDSTDVTDFPEFLK